MDKDRIKNKKGKILFLAKNLSEGGIQRVVSDFLNNLERNNIKLVLYENKIDYKCDVKKV